MSEIQRRKVQTIMTGWFPPGPPGVYGASPAALAEEIECLRCQHDLHRCPGCGDDIPHGVTACAECAQGETP